jgi:ParB-like chromosome segregation protein Spo0J
MKSVRSAFRPEVVRLALKDLVPSKDIQPRERKHTKYQQIATSLATVGLIEPIVVFPLSKGFRVLDGHKRLDILSRQNVKDVECIIGTTDEAYTYNRRVNYLSTIGEHQMIMRALRHNDEATIARVLDVDVSTIRKKRSLLDGICKEVVNELKDRRIAPRVFLALKKMKPVRQIAVARLMVASNAYSQKFALALLAGTSDEMLVSPRQETVRSLSAEQRARLVAETDSLLNNIKGVEVSYGEEALTLSVCCRYLDKLLRNKAILKYLNERHVEILGELKSLMTNFRLESSTSMSPIAE